MVTLSLIMHQVGLQIDASIQINDWLIDSLDLIGQERITASLICKPASVISDYLYNECVTKIKFYN